MFRISIEMEYSDKLSNLDINVIPAFLERNKEAFKLAEDEISELKSLLEQEFTTQHKLGGVIQDKESQHKKWWRGKLQNQVDNFYWKRFERLLIEAGSIPSESIYSNDKSTDIIMDLIANPNLPVQKRRGMVIGQVQAGKTVNYSSLICKAADAGYKYIVLLAGLTNSLRQQTQERLDEAFVGRISSNNTNVKKRVGVGKIDDSRAPFALTFFKEDFLLSNLQAIKGLDLAHINEIKEPLIFVCKKNTKTLANLNSFFSTHFENEKSSGSLLLLDDEADNASINTKVSKGDITAINAGIRSIIRKFDNSTYLGYTATPFANIFIDNDINDELTKDDLFPKDFIYALDASSKYVGAKRVFGADGDLGQIMLREINDNNGYLEKIHKKDVTIEELPPSLKTAVRLFLLAKAIRDFRGQKNKHCSMMVNVSRFNAVQDKVKSLISDYILMLQEDLRLNANSKNPSKSSIVHQLQADYQEEYLYFSDEFDYPPWKSITPKLSEILSNLDIVTVNMNSGELNYENSSVGQTVIAIGGLALSRGLTLEGLVTTYILRNAAAYDTLLQLARWFGYRPNYEDVCRVFIDAESQQYYSDVSETIEELTDEIKEMRQLELTPMEFGIKIKENPNAIRITAANKMTSAELLPLELGFSGKRLEGHALFNDDRSNNHNRTIISNFIERIKLDKLSVSHPNAKDRATWKNVNVDSVLYLLDNFRLPARYCSNLSVRTDGTSFVTDFIRDKIKWLSEWTVCIQNRIVGNTEGAETTLIPGMSLKVINNEHGIFLDEGNVFGITSRRRVGSANDLTVGVEYNVKHVNFKKSDIDKPILNIYVNQVSVGAKNTEKLKTNLSSNSVTIGVFFPIKKELEKARVSYQVNKIFRELKLQVESDDDEDDYNVN